MKATTAKTKNVMAAFDAYQTIYQASLEGSPAICLFSGKSGLGKTTAGAFLFVQADGVLVRCYRADTFPKPSKQVNTSTITSITTATTETQGYSEEQKSEFEKRRKELEAVEAIRTSAEPTFSSDHQKARYFTERKTKGLLSPSEKAWLHQYRRENRRAAAMLDNLYQDNTANKGK